MYPRPLPPKNPVRFGDRRGQTPDGSITERTSISQSKSIGIEFISTSAKKLIDVGGSSTFCRCGRKMSKVQKRGRGSSTKRLEMKGKTLQNWELFFCWFLMVYSDNIQYPSMRKVEGGSSCSSLSLSLSVCVCVCACALCV